MTARSQTEGLLAVTPKQSTVNVTFQPRSIKFPSHPLSQHTTESWLENESAKFDRFFNQTRTKCIGSDSRSENIYKFGRDAVIIGNLITLVYILRVGEFKVKRSKSERRWCREDKTLFAQCEKHCDCRKNQKGKPSEAKIGLLLRHCSGFSASLRRISLLFSFAALG